MLGTQDFVIRDLWAPCNFSKTTALLSLYLYPSSVVCNRPFLGNMRLFSKQVLSTKLFILSGFYLYNRHAYEKKKKNNMLF